MPAQNEYNEEVAESKISSRQEVQRFKNRRRMAWLSMVSMITFTGILFTDFIEIERIRAIDNVIEMFYIAMASVVGAYMGFTTWASKGR